jgi:hypothetical protein
VSAPLIIQETRAAVTSFNSDVLAGLNVHLSARGCDLLHHEDIFEFDRVYRAVQDVHGDFLYLLWRTEERQHKCSLALTEGDLDLHVWLGTGDTPALALAAALLKSVQTITGEGRPL